MSTFKIYVDSALWKRLSAQQKSFWLSQPELYRYEFRYLKDYQQICKDAVGHTEAVASGVGGLGSTLLGVSVVATAVVSAPVSAPIAAIGGICIGAGGAAIAHAIRLSK